MATSTAAVKFPVSQLAGKRDAHSIADHLKSFLKENCNFRLKGSLATELAVQLLGQESLHHLIHKDTSLDALFANKSVLGVYQEVMADNKIFGVLSGQDEQGYFSRAYDCKTELLELLYEVRNEGVVNLSKLAVYAFYKAVERNEHFGTFYKRGPELDFAAHYWMMTQENAVHVAKYISMYPCPSDELLVDYTNTIAPEID